MEPISSSPTYFQPPPTTPFEQETESLLANLITTVENKQNNWQEDAPTICQQLVQNHQWKYFRHYAQSEVAKKMALLGIACLLHNRTIELQWPENMTTSSLLENNSFFQNISTCLNNQIADNAIQQKLLQSEWSQEQKNHIFHFLRALCHTLPSTTSLSTYLPIDAHKHESVEQKQTRQYFTNIFKLIMQLADLWKTDLILDPHPHGQFVLDVFPIDYLANHPGALESMMLALKNWVHNNSSSVFVKAFFYKFCTHVNHALFTRSPQAYQSRYTTEYYTNTALYLEFYDSIIALSPSIERSCYFFCIAELAYQHYRASPDQQWLRRAENVLANSMKYLEDHWKTDGWYIYYSGWIQLHITIQKEIDPYHDFSQWKILLKNHAPQQDPIIQEILKNFS